jgi:hypothetical protein
MTFLEALYGSQYAEIKQNGRDGNKGRFNGNIFLATFVLILVMALLFMLSYFVPMFGKGAGRFLQNTLGFFSGRAMGKIIALVLGGLFYFIITKTVGTEENFNRLVDNYMNYPEEVRNKALKKLLFPFFLSLLVLIVFAFLID